MDFENENFDANSELSEEMELDNPAGYGTENGLGVQLGLQATGTLPTSPALNQNVVILPPGVELDDIQVSGRNLVVTLPDGEKMIIPDGAVFVPQIVIDGVTIPPLNLAALLVGNEPQPAAGPPQSSGGNFADPVGDIGDPFALGDLLPPTALSFPEREQEEIFPFEPDEDDDEPDAFIITTDNPAGAVSATDRVDESGLPARGSEPEGTNAAGNGETTAGTIIFVPGDGPAVVSINGTAVTAVGQTISGTFGTLTITSISEGSIGYSYTLADNTSGDNTSDVFAVSVVDADGDTATADLTIAIIDDAPTAVADTDSIAAGEYGPAIGNVITDAEGDGGADTQGADGAVVAGVAAGDTGTALVDGGTVGTQIAGLYGVLTINTDGSYSYTRNEDSPGGVSDVFTYTLQDGDGDTSVTTLTIDIADSPATLNLPVSGEAGAIVDEEGLPARGTESPGSNAASDVEATEGTINFSAADGPGIVTINGVAVTAVGQTFVGTFGTLTITGIANGAITYSYTLADNTSGDDTSDDFAITVTDQDGDSASGTLSIQIIDDEPTAVLDTDSIAAGEYGPATGNVITDAEGDGGADTQGADGALVAGVVAGDTGAVLLDAGTVGTQIAGLYGVLTLNADGSYSYTRNEDSPGGVSDVFTYTLQDGDGDTSVTTLTIDIADSPVTLTLPVSGEAGTIVDEAGLPARGAEPEGTDAAGDGETTAGSITFSAPDGPGTVSINGVEITTVGQTIVGNFGTMTITGISNGVITYSYTLADNTDGDATADDFAVVVTDADGDTVSGTLTIDIIDDEPIAQANTAVQLDDDALAGGNAGGTGDVDPDTANTSGTLGHVFGADGGTIAFLPSGAPAGFTYELSGNDLLIKQGTTTVITVTLDPATGAYTVTQNAAILHADGGDENNVSFTLNYRITDGDGDTADGTLQINVDDDTPTVAVTNETEALIVDESDLTTDASASFSGIFTSSFGADGAGSIVYTLGVIAGSSGLVDTATGQNVILSLNGGVVEGRTENGGDLVFTVTVAADGTVTLDQIRAVVHGDTTNPDDAAFLSASNLITLTATVTDADNDQASATAEIGSSFVFRDDGPAIDAAVVDNDSVMLVTQDAETIGAASDTAVSTGNFGGAFSIASSSFGADGAGSISWAYALVVDNAASGLTSNGVDIVLTLNGTVVEGRAGGELIFSIAVDASSGVVTLAQFAEIDHALPGDSANFDGQLAMLANGLVSLEGTATITDRDGDSAFETVSLDLGGNIKFADDGPTVADGESAGTVDEDGLTGGIPDGTGDVPGEDPSVSGSVVSLFNPGADAPLTYQILTDTSGLPALTSGGVAVTYSIVGNVLTASAGTTTVFTFTLDADTGTWTFVLSGPLDHADGMDENDIDINFGSLIQATDDDGDFVTATGSVVVTVDDDTPTATNEASQDVNEGATVTGTLDFAGGADGATVTAINGTALVFGPDGFSQSIDIGAGVIKVKADGTYEFTADDATISPVPPTVATFTVTDGDNDTATATVTFQIVDANTPTGGQTVAAVDDDGLTGGNSASTIGDLDANSGDLEVASEAVFQGTLNFSFGGDGAGSVGFASMNGQTAMVGQEMVTYSWDAGSNTLTATGPRGVLFTVEVTNTVTGAFTVTLVDNVLHAQGPNDENDALASLTYTVTDADGSTATGGLSVTFDDDAPTATDEASQDVNEGATITGTLDFMQGADGATVTHIGNTVLVFGADGFSQSIDIGAGSIKVKADGSYEFTADNPAISPVPPTSATFTVTDSDGDTATATVNFQVVDANVPTAGTTEALVDDDGLAGGNPLSIAGDALDANADGDNDETTFGGTLALNFGADGPGSVGFAAMDGLTAMVGQETVTFSWNAGSNTLTATGPRGALFTVEVTNPTTGAFTVTLLDNVLHAQGPNDENDATVALTYTVTDSDNSTANGTLNITFDDDAPTVALSNDDLPILVTDDTDTPNDTAGPVSFAGLFDTVFGADGAKDADNNDVADADAVTYALGITGGNGANSGLVDTLTGDAILLRVVGDTIEGYLAGSTGTVAFTITLDVNAGTISFEQDRAVVHNDPNDPVESGASAAMFADDLITLTATATDDDGDTATATANIGGAFQLEDDGPDAVVVNAVADMLILDESADDGSDPDGDNGAPEGTNVATANFADNFGATIDYGTDGPGSVAYALTLSADGIGSGLFALGVGGAQGSEIQLFNNGGTIEGRVGNTVYFTIAVDNNPANATFGEVTFMQMLNVWHGDTGNDDELAELTLDGGGEFLRIEQTVTDADGDSDSAAIELGSGVFKIEDDGPDAVVDNAVPTPMLVLDESPVGTETDGNSAPAGLATVTANFAANFGTTIDYGTDGAGSVAYALTLTGSDVGSGLFALGMGGAQGAEILLNQAADGTITGSVGGTDYFKISVNATTGEITFTQINNIWHGNIGSDDEAAMLTLASADLLTIDQTVTDADGDSDTASIDLGADVFKIEDDGPDAVVDNAVPTPMLVLDESPVGTETDGNSAPAGLATVTANFAANFGTTIDYGTDGAGSVSYGLVLGAVTGSGLFALGMNGAQGAEIQLVQTNATTITGSVGGTPYFTITVDNDPTSATFGSVTFTQINNIWHGDTASDDEAAILTMASANGLTLTQTVTDADGDSDRAALNLGTGVFKIEDDGPDAVVTNATADMLILDESPEAPNGDGIRTVSAELADNFGAVIDYGTDGPGTVAYALTLSANGVGSGLFAIDASDVLDSDGDGIGQGSEIQLFNIGGVIEGKVGAAADGTGGTTYFTISVNTTTGQITFTQLANIWHSDATDPDDLETLTLDGVGEFLRIEQTVTDADGDTDTAAIELGDNVFKIEDDGPGTMDNPVVLLDDDALTGGNPMGTGDDADSANTMGTLSHDFGTDGAGSITFLTTGAPAGFDYVASGSDILVQQSQGGSMVTVLTVTLNSATGAYTVTQNANILHASGGDENNVQFTLNYKVVDGDNDPVPGTLVINVDDDTPTATDVTATPVLDDDAQTDGNPGGTGDVADNISVTGAAGALFSPGADGVKSIAVTTPTMTAIFVDANGVATQEAVTWNSVTNADGSVTVTGSSAKIASVAVLTVNTDGSYSYTQNAPVVSSASGTPGSEETDNFVFGVTVTDGDDDTANSDLTIQINDDTPTASDVVATDLSDDEGKGDFAASSNEGVGTGAAGTDVTGSPSTISGIAGTLFAAGADGTGSIVITGPAGIMAIHDTDGDGLANQEALAYSSATNASGGVTLTATGVDSGDMAFALLINADGSYLFTQNSALVHPTIDNEDDLPLLFNFTVTDGDGDAATGSLTVTVDDDTPVDFVPTNASVANTAGPATAPVALNFGDAAGADGVGDIMFNVADNTQLFDSDGRELQFGGEEIFLFNVGADGHVIEGRTADGDLAFTATLNPSGDSYTIDLEGSIFNIDEFSFTDLSGTVGGGNVNFKGLGIGSGATQDILISGNDSVNTNSTEIGIGSGNDIGPGDIARFDMVSNLAVQAAGPANNGTGFTHTGHYEVGKFVQEISFVQGNNQPAGVTITIRNGDGDFDYLGDATGETAPPDITVNVYSSNPALGGATLIATFTDTDNDVVVTGLQEGYYIEITSSDPFSIVEYSDQTGRPFKLGAIQIETANVLEEFNFELPITATDGDGDSIDSTITVELEPSMMAPLAPIAPTAPISPTNFLGFENEPIFRTLDTGERFASNDNANNRGDFMLQDANGLGDNVAPASNTAALNAPEEQAQASATAPAGDMLATANEAQSAGVAADEMLVDANEAQASGPSANDMLVDANEAQSAVSPASVMLATANQPQTNAGAAKNMLANANEAQAARQTITTKAQTTSQIVIAATLLAANGRPEETNGQNDISVVSNSSAIALDPNAVQEQAQPEAVQLAPEAPVEAASPDHAEETNSPSTGGSDTEVDSSGDLDAGSDDMIVEESSGNNEAQPGFNASEFQTASGLQLDVGIAMNMEALTPVGESPSPVQIDIDEPDAPPATVEEIVADAVDGGTPETVTIDAIIDTYTEETEVASAEADTGYLDPEYLENQPLPEQVLELLVQGDAGPVGIAASDPMQMQMDMQEAGQSSG